MVLLGYRVYAYELDGRAIRQADIIGYTENLNQLTQDIVTLLADEQYKFAACFGNSWGSEQALYVAAHNNDIDAVVLNTVRGSIAEFVMNDPAGLQFKATYVARLGDQTAIAKAVASVESLGQVTQLGDRPVLVYYSIADEVLLPKNTEKLIAAMRQAKVKLTVIQNQAGSHLWASIINHARWWRWHSFLKAVERQK